MNNLQTLTHSFEEIFKAVDNFKSVFPDKKCAKTLEAMQADLAFLKVTMLKMSFYQAVNEKDLDRIGYFAGSLAEVQEIKSGVDVTTRILEEFFPKMTKEEEEELKTLNQEMSKLKAQQDKIDQDSKRLSETKSQLTGLCNEALAPINKKIEKLREEKSKVASDLEQKQSRWEELNRKQALIMASKDGSFSNITSMVEQWREKSIKPKVSMERKAEESTKPEVNIERKAEEKKPTSSKQTSQSPKKSISVDEILKEVVK